MNAGCGTVAMYDVFSIPLHGECLSRACWTVHENSAILAIQKGIAQILPIDLVEHFLLRSVLV